MLRIFKVLVKEEDRLATVIAAINYDVAIVPRGSYLRSADGNIYSNRCFEGCNVTDILDVHITYF